MKRLGDLIYLAILTLVSVQLAEQPAVARAVRQAPTGTRPVAQAGHRGQTEPTPRDWKHIARAVFDAINEDRLLANAAGVTFYGLLALFPALATLISFYGLFADPRTIERQVNAMQGVVPGGGVDLISQQLHSLVSSPHQALGFGAIVGILIALWSANSGTKAVFDALNVAFEVKETRSYVQLTWRSLLFTLGGLVFVVLAIGAFVAVPAIIHVIHLGAVGNFLIEVVRWPLLLIAVGLALAFLYRFGPDRPNARWHWISWGSAFASVLWLLVSAIFSFYVANFGSYNKTYGSLGAAVGFMTWIWLSTTVVLIGAELNAELEKTAPAG